MRAGSTGDDACPAEAGYFPVSRYCRRCGGGGRVLAAYGEPVDGELLRVCEQLRRLHLTVRYSIYAERLPECRSRAIELLAAWL